VAVFLAETFLCSPLEPTPDAMVRCGWWCRLPVLLLLTLCVSVSVYVRVRVTVSMCVSVSVYV
jgi:hypothetical protein